MAVLLINKSPTVLVKPSSPPMTSATVEFFSLIGLSSYDVPNMGQPVTAFLVFEHPIDNPVETIRRGLSLALVLYYPISGCITHISLSLGVECTGIHCPDEGGGVPFVAASADAALRDVDLRGHQEDLAVFYPAAGDPCWRPLLLVQVTVFSCGGFVVAMTWDHAMRAVGELARGMPSPSVVPLRHDLNLAYTPSAIKRVDQLVNSLQPSLLTLLTTGMAQCANGNLSGPSA